MNYEGEKFLLKLYRELYKDENVLKAEKRSGNNSENKYELIRKYLERLSKQEKIFDDEHEKMEDYLLSKYYEKYTLKEENIPNSYWQHREQMLLERGHGDVKYSEDGKHKEWLKLKKDQEVRLKIWLNYLLKEHTSYPMWVRYWAFQGMLKLGSYDKKRHRFNKRSAKTVANFPELDAEVLAKTIELVMTFTNKEKIEDKELEEIISSGNFGKLYAYNLWKVTEERKEIAKSHSTSTVGVWIKYKKGDAKKVEESLEGKGTGWCVAGYSVAHDYLEIGELNIYYTKDKNGEYTVPRACIRTINGSIEEVRGIEEGQVMEPEMLEIVDKELDKYPDKEKYKKKVRDMKKVTEIYNKIQNKNELILQDIRFILELDGKIEGFGWSKDPRINQILQKLSLTDKDLCLEAVKRKGSNLQCVCKELKKDEEIVLAAVRNDGCSLQYADEKLKKDKKIVLAAVREYGCALQYADKELTKDEEIVLEAMKQDEYALEYADKKFRSDKKIILEGIKKKITFFKCASKELKKDREFILEAVKINDYVLYDADKELRNDRDFVLKVFQECKWLTDFKYAGDNLKGDRKFVLEILKHYDDYNSIMYWINEELKKDREFILEAVKINGEIYVYADQDLKKDREIILEALKHAGDIFLYVPEEFRKDREIVLEAVKQDAYNISFADKRLQNDREIIAEAKKHHYYHPYTSDQEETENDFMFDRSNKM